MSIVDTLIAAGADCVAGDLIFANVSMGKFRNGSFFPSDEGMKMFESLQNEKTLDMLLVARQYLDAAPVPEDNRMVKDYEIGEIDLEPAPVRRGRRPKAE